MKIDCEMIGGPLDGAKWSGDIDISKPFIIVKASDGGMGDSLYCCYHYKEDGLHYVESKTSAEMEKMKAKR